MFRLLQKYFTILNTTYLSGVWMAGKAQIYRLNLPLKINVFFKLIFLNNKIFTIFIDTFKIGILQDDNTDNSTNSGIELNRISFSEFGLEKFIQTKHFKIFYLPSDSLLKFLDSSPKVLLIDSKSDSNLNKILQLCNQDTILNSTFNSNFTSRGFSIGFYSGLKNLIKILINSYQLKKGRVDFEAQFLQLAKIYC